MPQEYFTVEEVARHFKVTEQFIRNEITRKRLHANKIGREWRISSKDMEDYERDTHTGRRSSEDSEELEPVA